MSSDFLKSFRNLFGSEPDKPEVVYDPELVKEVQNEIKSIIDSETGRERLVNFWNKKYKKIKMPRIINFFFVFRNNTELYLFNQSITSVFIAGTVLGGLNSVAQNTDNYKRSSQLQVYVDKKSANVNIRSTMMLLKVNLQNFVFIRKIFSILLCRII